MFKSFVFFTLATTALTAPTIAQLDTRQSEPFQQTQLSAWDAGAVDAYPIHSSCNATQRAQITAGLNEAILLAGHAKDHVLRWGNSSDLYRRYFGHLPPYEVIGSLDIIVSGDKGGVLFRCDNPDGNCANAGWAGHWRGSNATEQTVICDLSYQTRRFLSSMCGMGYTVAGSKTNTFWASDLMHRLYHMPAIGLGYIEHYIHSYNDAITWAKNDTVTNTHDSDVLQYFALDVYAYDIAVPGVGCSGATNANVNTASSTSSTVPTSSTTASTATSVTTTNPAAASQTATQTTSAPANCHTHSDGVVHCD